METVSKSGKLLFFLSFLFDASRSEDFQVVVILPLSYGK